jgi:hypothetical protein
VPHSSTHKNSSGAIPPASSRQVALSSSSRSEAKRDFFERPLPRQASDAAAHRGGGDPHGVLVLECLAVLFEGEVGIGPKLARAATPQAPRPCVEGARARPSSARRRRSLF